MTSKQRQKFVKELIGNVKVEIIAMITKDIEEMEEWDGIELRQYIAEHFTKASFTWGDQSFSRRTRYRNTCLVHNL